MRSLRFVGREERLEQILNGIGRRPLPSQRIAIVTMVRDELDILPSFLAHHLALVDRIHVVDHRSVDGTRQYLEQLSRQEAFRRSLAVYRYDQEAYNQAAIMTAMLHRAFAEGHDWVLPLDADEFLPAASSDELRVLLGGSVSPVARLDWVNVMPRLTGDNAPGAPFDPRGRFERISAGYPARFGKVMLHRSLVKVFPGAETWTGQHKLRPFPSAPKTRGTRCGELLHVPARSVKQVLSKRTNLTTNPDFAGTYPVALAEKNREQQALAERVAERQITSEEAAAVFEAVLLPYEPPEVAGLSREEWIRQEVSLPATLVPGPDLLAAVDGESASVRDASTSPPAPVTVFRHRMADGKIVRIDPDRTVTVRVHGGWDGRRVVLRLLGEVRMLTSLQYLLSPAVARMLRLLGRVGVLRR